MKVSLSLIRIDFALQAVMLGINLLLTLSLLFQPEGLFILLYLQFLVGVYQVVLSGIPHLLLKKTLDPRLYEGRRYHMIFSCLYVSLFVVLYESGNQIIGMILLIIIPQLIAYAYGVLTYLDYRSRVRYLDNRSTIYA